MLPNAIGGKTTGERGGRIERRAQRACVRDKCDLIVMFPWPNTKLAPLAARPLPPTGNVILSAIFTLWAFVGLAIVCDEFFQPSLEAISEALNLSPDVAGATFLAAGSSAPELFTSLADAFGNASR